MADDCNAEAMANEELKLLSFLNCSAIRMNRFITKVLSSCRSNQLLHKGGSFTSVDCHRMQDAVQSET